MSFSPPREIFSPGPEIFFCPPGNIFCPPDEIFFRPGLEYFILGGGGKLRCSLRVFRRWPGLPSLKYFHVFFCRLHESRRPDGTQLNLRPRRRLRAAGNIFCPAGNIFSAPKEIFFSGGGIYFSAWTGIFLVRGGKYFWSSEGRVSPEGAWGSENPWVDVSPSAEVGGSTGAARRILAKATSPAGHWWKLADAAARAPPSGGDHVGIA